MIRRSELLSIDTHCFSLQEGFLFPKLNVTLSKDRSNRGRRSDRPLRLPPRGSPLRPPATGVEITRAMHREHVVHGSATRSARVTCSRRGGANRRFSLAETLVASGNCNSVRRQPANGIDRGGGSRDVAAVLRATVGRSKSMESERRGLWVGGRSGLDRRSSALRDLGCPN